MNRRGVISPAGVPVVAGCVALVAGAGCGWALHLPPQICMLIAAVAAVVALSGRARAVAVIIALAAAGAWRGAAAVHVPGVGTVDGHLTSSAVTLYGTVREGQLTRNGSALVVDVRRIVGADVDAPVAGGVVAFLRGTTGPVVQPGDEVELQASSLRRPDARPGAWSADTLERDGVHAVAESALVTVTRPGGRSPARALAAVRSALVTAVERALPPTEATLLLGVAFGIHRGMPAATSAALQDSGLIHVVALSGLKVAIVAGLVGSLAALLAWSPRRRLVATAVCVVAYVLFAGATAAAVRSALMAIVGLAGRSRGRPPDRLPLLAVCAAAMLLVQPSLIGDPGYELSFLGTFAILVAAAPLAERIPGPRWVAEPLAVTLAAQAGTFPVTAATFHSVAWFGPIANALVLPLLPAAVLAGAAASVVAALSPGVGAVLLDVAALPERWIALVASTVSRLPGAAWHPQGWPVAATVLLTIASAAVIAAVALVRHGDAVPRHRPLPSRRLGVATALVLTAALGVPAGGAVVVAASLQPSSGADVVVLDLGGQGSATLVTAGSGTALVDAGADANALLDAVGSRLPLLHHRIDLLVVTGGARSVAGGLAGMAGRIGVGAVVAAAPLTAGESAGLRALDASGARVGVVPCGSAWPWASLRWMLLPGDDGVSGSGTACAVEVGSAAASALLLGDVPSAAQGAITPGAPMPALVVAPPASGVSATLLATIQPRWVAVPAGRGPTGLGPGVAVGRVASDGALDYRFTASGIEAA